MTAILNHGAEDELDIPEHYDNYRKTLTPLQEEIYNFCIVKLENNDVFMNYAYKYNNGKLAAYHGNMYEAVNYKSLLLRVAKYLNKFKITPWPSSGKKEVILDIGCGSGYFSYFARMGGHTVYSLDAPLETVGQKIFIDGQKALGLNMTYHTILPFQPLPYFPKPCTLAVAFNPHFYNPGLKSFWRFPQWHYFMCDLAKLMSHEGRIYLPLIDISGERDVPFFGEQATKDFFMAIGKIEIGHICEIEARRIAGASLSGCQYHIADKNGRIDVESSVFSPNNNGSSRENIACAHNASQLGPNEAFSTSADVPNAEPGTGPRGTLLEVLACTFCGDALTDVENGQNCKKCGSRARVRALKAVLDNILFPWIRKRPLADLPLLAFAMSRNEIEAMSSWPVPIKHVDLQGSAFKQCERGVDVRDLSRYPAASFSSIYSCLLFDYFPEHEQVLGECWRILTPGGIFMTCIAPGRLSDGYDPPHILGRAKTGNGAEFPSVKVGSRWFAHAMRSAGFNVHLAAVRDTCGVTSTWFLGYKPMASVSSENPGGIKPVAAQGYALVREEASDAIAVVQENPVVTDSLSELHQVLGDRCGSETEMRAVALARARELCDQGCYGKTLSLANAILKAFPDSARELLPLKAKTYEKNRQFFKAASIWDKLLTADPENVNYRFGLAHGMAAQGLAVTAATILLDTFRRSEDIRSKKLVCDEWLCLGLLPFAPDLRKEMDKLGHESINKPDLRLWLDIVLNSDSEAYERYVDSMSALGSDIFLRPPVYRKVMACLARLAGAQKYAGLRLAIFALHLQARKAASPHSAEGSFQKPLAFAIESHSIHFFESVILQFSPQEAEIVIPSVTTGGVAKISPDSPLTSYIVSYGVENLSKYKCIVLDSMVKYDPLLGQRVIGVAHAVDNYFSGQYLENLHGIICMSRNYAIGTGIELLPDECDFVASIDPDAKCEKAYSGPYHASQWLSADRIQLRALICAEYGIADDRPFILFMEDEVCQHGQIVHCITELSKFCHVFFKPLLIHSKPKLMGKLGVNTHVVNTPDLAPNVLRFGCDYIFASFYSGTLLSSVMLGLTPLCYYSKYYYSPHKMATPAHVDNYIDSRPTWQEEAFGFRDPKISLLRFLRSRGMMFDLLDHTRIRRAITGGAMAKFYETNRQQIDGFFGHFYRDDAHLRTAALIHRFSKEGSFGEDCASLHIKNHEFDSGG